MIPSCAVPPAEIVIMAAEEEINETLTVTGEDITLVTSYVIILMFRVSRGGVGVCHQTE